MTRDIDSVTKRISYLHLYPIHLNPDEDSTFQLLARRQLSVVVLRLCLYA